MFIALNLSAQLIIGHEITIELYAETVNKKEINITNSKAFMATFLDRF